MVNLQYFIFVITTSFTNFSSLKRQSHFEGLLRYNFISRSSQMIFYTCSVYVGTSPTTSLFVKTCQNRFTTDYTGLFLPTRYTITKLTAKNSALVGVYHRWSLIDCFFANYTGGIWISFVLLTHSSSIP
jgi:hypothetical protein